MRELGVMERGFLPQFDKCSQTEGVAKNLADMRELGAVVWNGVVNLFCLRNCAEKDE